MVWHVIIDGEQRGPLSRDQILEYLHDGQLVGSDLIWRPGFSNWKQVRELAEFWHPPRRGASPPPLPVPAKPPERPEGVPPLPPRGHTSRADGPDQAESLWPGVKA